MSMSGMWSSACIIILASAAERVEWMWSKEQLFVCGNDVRRLQMRLKMGIHAPIELLEMPSNTSSISASFFQGAWLK